MNTNIASLVFAVGLVVNPNFLPPFDHPPVYQPIKEDKVEFFNEYSFAWFVIGAVVGTSIVMYTTHQIRFNK